MLRIVQTRERAHDAERALVVSCLHAETCCVPSPPHSTNATRDLSRNGLAWFSKFVQPALAKVALEQLPYE